MRTRLAAAILVLLLSVARAAEPTEARPEQARRTSHVFLVMLDGLRWQEVFRGAQEDLISKENGVENIRATRDAFMRDSPGERRMALMPFLWSEVATKGVLFGNRDKKSNADITNAAGVSYPGYSETFCGYADPAIDSNRQIPNPNVTVFEWLNQKPAFAGRVAAFGAWETFEFIFNRPRAGFFIDAGCKPITQGRLTPTIDTMNRVRAETPYRWNGAPFDSFVFIPAKEWISANHPRVVFLGLGETDEWAHDNRYDQYLAAARRDDAYLRELWEYLQATPEYKDSTTLIICCDHGRGTVLNNKPDWPNHGAKHPGSSEIWIGVLGPDTPARGELKDAPTVTQSQIAATIAALLGEDYNAAQPKAGAALPGVVPSR